MKKITRFVLGVGYLKYTFCRQKGACRGAGLFEKVHLSRYFRKDVPEEINGYPLRLFGQKVRLIIEPVPPRRRASRKEK